MPFNLCSRAVPLPVSRDYFYNSGAKLLQNAFPATYVTMTTDTSFSGTLTMITKLWVKYLIVEIQRQKNKTTIYLICT